MSVSKKTSKHSLRVRKDYEVFIMAKLNFKTVSKDVTTNFVLFLNKSLEKKSILKTASKELSDLKEERKSLYEDGAFLEGVALHDNKSLIEQAKKDALAPINKELATITENLVNKSFYEEYKLVTDKETITTTDDTRWKNVLATYLSSIGVGGTDNERNIDKFNPYRWTGKGKGYTAFRNNVTNDLASILVEKGVIVYSEEENVYKVA